MADEEQMKQLFMQFQTLQQNIEQLTEHVQKLHQQNAEIEESVTALKEFSETPKDTDVFAPIANGIFIKGKVVDNQKLLVNVGADTIVEKSVDDVTGMLAKHQHSMAENILQAESLLQNFEEQAMKIYQEVEKEHAA
ncbi:prefoldin subunit alpha [Candidatus Woesearchaeota archaeon]|jgi:prefoldin alpha subunit|nr:prefoldin subunit alpha [Candidatus Woesearchaeota archaeon]MBT5397527.1 prefoldin subunit alpha [Candidatus Woesearchaeota archaeon]MBT5924735.1 prefoldin subunit alpha [Candidatus Woesearchaeota archaeon]MBT6367900.1 prefoldin subunit alpha [Candidatus Woesearchaeota archaeon]MBT7763124.1 prefoldin subunit alpha [Candidatus Woesearchaeota archaeon]